MLTLLIRQKASSREAKGMSEKLGEHFPNVTTLHEVPHVTMTPPTVKLLSLVLHNFSFATVRNCSKGNKGYAGFLICDS